MYSDTQLTSSLDKYLTAPNNNNYYFNIRPDNNLTFVKTDEYPDYTDWFVASILRGTTWKNERIEYERYSARPYFTVNITPKYINEISLGGTADNDSVIFKAGTTRLEACGF